VTEQPLFAGSLKLAVTACWLAALRWAKFFALLFSIQEAAAMLSAVLGARQKRRLHFAPAGHVNTIEGCWNFLLSKAAFPCRPKTELKTTASLPAPSHVNPSLPGHIPVGLWPFL